MNIIDPKSDTLGFLKENQPDKLLLKKLLKNGKRPEDNIKINPIKDKIDKKD